jgi:hypothetical protein
VLAATPPHPPTWVRGTRPLTPQTTS